LNTKTEKFEVSIPNLDGTAVAERVPVEVPVYFDERIQEWVLTEAAHQIIDDTRARYMGLILPSQMKELRERLGFSQSQMGQLFQIGEKSWSRWESGKHRPTRSMGLLIMAAYEGKIPMDYLLSKAGLSPKTLLASFP
jgi:DNA-binding transcriptional regulator YiaG